jgi:hypothetical protein
MIVFAFSFYACLAPVANVNQPKALVGSVVYYFCHCLNKIGRKLDGEA